VFQVSIATGLEQGTINTAFNCQQSNPFFLGCFINYVPTTGLLSIGFSGVNPPNQFGQKEGIPPLLPGCLSNPDAPGCRDVGHFIITLNDNFALNGASGGWSQTANPVLFPMSQITFGVAEIP